LEIGTPPRDGEIPNHPSTLETGRSAHRGELSDVLGIGTLVGRYLVLERLGAGAMGVAYAAYDPQLDRKIALKLLRPRQGDGDQALRQERLFREAKAIAKLSHPNIVSIFDVGVHRGEVFLAMEYLGGGTLARWVGARKRRWREVIEIFVEVGRGLAAAHEEKLIHRDFKPENVLLDKNGVAKVVDFGLVRWSGSIDSPINPGSELDDCGEAEPSENGGAAVLTRSGAVMGTPAYMAPEQFVGNDVDARTDQFAFCVSLYQALYGERPFAGHSLEELSKSVTRGLVRATPEDSVVPGWIRKVIRRGLAVEPAQRYPNMLELLQALMTDPVARRRRRLGVAAALLVAAAAIIGLQRRFEHSRSEFDQSIAARLAEGDRAFSEAQGLRDRALILRSRAFALFDARDRDGGERAWAESRATSASYDGALARAQRALEAALAMDQGRTETRRRLAEAVYDRAILAEVEIRQEDLARHLTSLETIDPTGEQRQRWAQPGSLSVGTTPSGARISIERFDSGVDSRPTTVPLGAILSSPVVRQALPPGSYRLRIDKSGHAPTLYPFLVRRGESLSFEVTLPRQGEIPDGFVYVPAGEFLFGEADEPLRSSFLDTIPLRRMHASGFLIARDETTFADWIEFLESLPPRERRLRTPLVAAPRGAIELRPRQPKGWELVLRPATQAFIAREGETILYPERRVRRSQDWLRFPVSGISATDAEAYFGWMRRTGRVPGARFCTETEWERAARGADGRVFPHGNVLLPDEANIDTTYSRLSLAFGPDEVGSHPATHSPFGVRDLCGNIIEMTTGIIDGSPVIARGGGYYWDRRSARVTNREPMEKSLRYPVLGLRVCADIKKPN
jgi:formylglycine-generating enzyme required for sulfatase activity